jgi:hypothetical protein
MPFAPKTIDGIVDPNINIAGRPTGKKTNRELREEALGSVKRKLTPQLKKSMGVMIELMMDSTVKPEVRAKIAKDIIDFELKVLVELYGKPEVDQSAEGKRVEEKAPVVNLKMVEKENKN